MRGEKSPSKDRIRGGGKKEGLVEAREHAKFFPFSFPSILVALFFLLLVVARTRFLCVRMV